MKVRELIAALQQLPPDEAVLLEGESGWHEPLVDEYQSKDHPDQSFIRLRALGGLLQPGLDKHGRMK